VACSDPSDKGVSLDDAGAGTAALACLLSP